MNSVQNQIQTLFLHPSTPHEAYPFDQIKEEMYEDVFAESIREYRTKFEHLITNPEAPTFENTIVALENLGASLEAVEGIFFNLLHCNGNDFMMELAEKLSPELTRLSNDITLSDALFARVKTVYEGRTSLSLDAADLRLLENCYKGFVRSGALLNEEDKKSLRKLREELSQDTLTFGNNVIKEENEYRLYIPDDEHIKMLPTALLDKARQRAKEERNCEGYLFDLSFPSIQGIMKFCTSTELRQTMFLAKARLCCKQNETDNSNITRRIVNNRLKVAQLLGYPTYADWVLEERMLNTPQKVCDFLEHLRTAYIDQARAEMAQIAQLKQDGELDPWDIDFYFERYREQHFAVAQEELRPYFPLNRVIQGVLGLAEKLYNIEFRQTTLPVYDQDVFSYEVWDNETKQFIGLLYLDFFPRKGKRSGAWMNNLREQEGAKRPHILLVMNFTPPTETLPSLLTPNEVNTFLHEFGHGLHGLLSQCKYTSLSGTNVVRDFVELPSQIMENWLRQPEFIQTFARHYQTEEPMPMDLLEKMLVAEAYPIGYSTLRQLSFGFLDMAYHTRREPLDESTLLEDFERNATELVRITPHRPKGCILSNSFGHLFSGGYAAGYYGYKWSEVLDADAFSLFLEQGIFDRKTAQHFRKSILERGDTDRAMQLFVAFRGREPQIGALLQRDGIPQK